jgi:hypothetical protein
LEADVRTFRCAPHAVRLALAPLMRANVGALLLMIRAFPDGVADDEAVAA